VGRLTNSRNHNPQQHRCGEPFFSCYGVAEGDGEGEAFDSFLALSFLVVELSFLLMSLDFLVEDFLVVDVLAGDFSGAVVVAVSVLLVLQAPRSPATARQVME
jgi:hypothetical protein